ncbi:MAG TPA: glycerol-3-phosphate dehydrogenase [Pyrinomonadaceae bacterium]|nr:glycerol-3-phosphate dehydrogenase [Pyrinomonadaceae bacterium]
MFDVVVIGAGINGAGIARDAAMRGLKVLLLDKADVGGGTTGWSTRLVHGGLRYLEHGELGLVRESLRERERLLKVAPHLVKPLPMLIPIYERQRRGRLTIRAGMLAYDALSFDKTLSHHRMLSRSETLRRAPGLAQEALRGAALYYDAQVEYPERLTLENALDAQAHGATVRTYNQVRRLETEGGRVRAAEVLDTLDGTTQTVRAEVFVNVCGPWVDEVLKGVDSPTFPRLIGGTKGSHIVTRAFDGAPGDALYVEALDDGRPFFIIPWNDLYLIGTTDIRYEGDLDAVKADEAEVDYLLRETNRVIPQARLTRRSVLYTYSGVRPLPFQEDASRNAGITRRHFIHDHSPQAQNLLSIVGGKITTYRNLSEQAVDLIFKKLRRSAPPCRTADTPLPGARAADFAAFAESFRRERLIDEHSREHLLRVYGTRAREVLETAEGRSELLEPLDDETGAIRAEVLFSFRHELARTLSDCLLRRTMIGMSAKAGLDIVEEAASVARRYLNWSEERALREVAAYREGRESALTA